MAVLLLIGSSRIATSQQPTQACSELNKDDPPAAMLAYLQLDRATLTYACIEIAIRKLTEAQYRGAIKTLIDYLDLKEPGSQHVIRPTQPLAGLYPAAVALSRFGDAAMPELKSAVSNDNNPKLLRVNAAETYLSMMSDRPAAISFLVKTAHGSVDADAGDAIMRIAERAAKICIETDQERCTEALNNQ